MKKWMILMSFLAGVSLCLGQTLRETVNKALENNLKLQAVEKQANAASAGSKAAFRATLPSLTVKSSAAYVTDVAEIDVAQMTGMPLGAIALGAHESYEASVNLSYVLFSGFAQKARVGMNRETETLARIQYESEKKNVALKTAALYRTIQGIELKIASLETAVERADLQLVRIRALVKSGMALGLDTLSINLGRLTFEQHLIEARSALETAQQNLEILAGERVAVSPQAAPVNETLPAISLGKMELMRRLDAQMRLKDQAVSLARSAFYPALAVQASYKYGKPGVNPVKNEWMNYATVGVGLEWRLFNWGSDAQQVKARRAERERVVLQKEYARQELKLAYDSKRREFESIQQQIQVSQRALELAREKMRVIQLQTEKGMVSATDFNDTNLELTQAELTLQEQRIQLAQKRQEIDFVSGRPLGAWHLE